MEFWGLKVPPNFPVLIDVEDEAEILHITQVSLS
jgi:hypothetical protein